MANRNNKPTKSPSAIRDHLLNCPKCSKHYNGNKFTILTKERYIYLLSVLESLFIKTYKPKLCKQNCIEKYLFNKNAMYLSMIFKNFVPQKV